MAGTARTISHKLRLRASAWLVGALAISCLLTIPALASVPAEVFYEYAQGGTFTGPAIGEMDVLNVAFPGGPPAGLALDSGGASLLWVITEFNFTAVEGQPARADPVDPVQHAYWQSLPAGRVTLSWPQEDEYDLLSVYGPGQLRQSPRPIRLSVDAEGGEWTGTKWRGEREAYYVPGKGGLVLHDGLGNWHRDVRLQGGGDVTIGGSFVMHVRGLRVGTDEGTVLDMGPHLRVETDLAGPLDVVERKRLIITDGFIAVGNGSIPVPMDKGLFAAQGMTWDLRGDLTLAGASGTYVMGSSSGTMERETLGLSGDIHLEESLPESPPDSTEAPPAIEGHAGGSFDILAVDFTVRAADAAGTSLMEQALWATLALAVVGFFVWLAQHLWPFLFTRIEPGAVLDHPRRADIMRFVTENPGCNALHVADRLGLARGVTRHHLIVLERAGRLRQVRDGGQVILVPAGQTLSAVLQSLASSDPHLSTIQRAVAVNGMRRSDLVALLQSRYGVADPTARRWIVKAIRLGMIQELGAGRSVEYRLAS